MKKKVFTKRIFTFILSMAIIFALIPITSLKAEARDIYKPQVDSYEKTISLDVYHPYAGDKVSEVGGTGKSEFTVSDTKINIALWWTLSGDDTELDTDYQFEEGKTYMFHASTTSPIAFNLQDYKYDILNGVSWNSGSEKTVRSHAHSTRRLLYTAEITVEKCNKGEYTLDLTSGSAIIDDESVFLSFSNWLEGTYIDGKTGFKVESEGVIQFDLNKDDIFDLMLIMDESLLTIYTLPGNSVKDNSYSIQLSDETMALKESVDDEMHGPYFSKVTVVFAKPANTGGSSESPSENITVESNPTPTVDEIKVTENIDTKQKKTSISKLKANKKSITVIWKKQAAKGIKGYEIQYSTDKSFKKDLSKKVTIKKVATTKTTIKKLKSKTRYYVRIRTFSKKNGKKVYSNWSKSKNIKVK